MSRGATPGFIEDPVENEGIWDLEELEDKTVKPVQWAIVGSKMYKAISSTHPRLPAGVYTVTLDRNDDTPVFIKRDVKVDALLRFKDSLADLILNEINMFWGKGKKFKEIGFLHRRGYLLYGPQGTGKSSIVNQIMTDIVGRKQIVGYKTGEKGREPIEVGGVVLICENPRFFNIGLATLRKAEPNRNLVCIFEDIDAIIRKYGEDELLSILDGSNMVDRVLNIATTNYPEMLDKRIVSRPRRFDRVIKIMQPSRSVREEYLRLKLPKGHEVRHWLDKTDGLSFAGITEAIISVCCLGNTLEDTIRIITDIENGHPNSNDFGTKGSLGFGGDGSGSGAGTRSDHEEGIRIPTRKFI